MSTPTSKTCVLCDVDKPLEAFETDPRSATGRRSQCTSCRQAYMQNYYRTRNEKRDYEGMMKHLDAVPAYDHEVREKFVRLHVKARAEGVKRCGCGAKLRVDNRVRGTCDPCHRRSMVVVERRAG